MIQMIAGVAAGGLLVGSLASWYFTAEYKDNQWGLAVANIQIDAAHQLQRVTDSVRIVEQANNEKVRQLEVQHDQEETRLADITKRNRQLAHELGGLRDPGRRQSGSHSVPSTAPDTTCTPDPTATGYLSREATEVLLNTATEVDMLVNYAMVGYKYAQMVNPPVVK